MTQHDEGSTGNVQPQGQVPSRDASLCAEYFAKHLAAYSRADVGGVVIERLVWRQPGTGINRIDYLCDGPRLFVAGDLGDAVYLTGARDLAWWTRCDLSYFAGKCCASEYGRGYETWDDDRALARLRHEVAQMRSDGEEIDADAVLAAEEAVQGGRGEWDAWMREHAHELFGDEWWDFVPNFGLGVDQRCALHLAGLKAAMAQVRATEVAAGSVVLALEPSRSFPLTTGMAPDA